jgi:hypothetical protein
MCYACGLIPCLQVVDHSRPVHQQHDEGLVRQRELLYGRLHYTHHGRCGRHDALICGWMGLYAMCVVGLYAMCYVGYMRYVVNVWVGG